MAAVLCAFAGAFLTRAAAGVDSWTWRNPSFPSQVNAIVHGGSGWVMVGGGGATALSPDGSSWTTGTAGTSYLTGVAYGQGKYEAVGTDGTIMSSTDGQTWTATRGAGGLNGQAAGIAFGSGTWVVISSNGEVLTSADGIAWSTQQLSVTEPTFALRGLGYGNGLFVIVGSAGGADALIFTSPDGQTWTRQAQTLTTSSAGFAPGDTLNLLEVAYGNGHYVAVGDSDVVLVSSDGVAWARHVVPHVTNRTPQLHSVAFANGTFVIGSPTSAYCLVSSDTINWDEEALPASTPAFAITALATDGTTFLAGDPHGQIALKPAGTDWTLVSRPSSPSDAGIAYGNGRFVITGSGSFTSSSDAMNWTTVTGIGSAHGPIAFGNGVFVTDDVSTAGTYTSPDGVTWTPHNAAVSMNALLFTRGRFYTAAYDYLGSSSDGITWTAATPPESARYTGLADGNGTLVAVGGFLSSSGSAVATSTDGVTWVARTGPAQALSAVAFGAGRFVAAADSGIAMWTSVDGSSWTPVTLPAAPSSGYASQWIRSVTYAGGTFVASVGGDLLTSTDGLNWTVQPRAFGSTQFAFGFAYGNGSFVAIGNGQIYQSAPDAGAIAITLAADAVAAAPGASASLSVTATGTGLTYQWFSGTSGDTAMPITGATAASYTVPAVTADGTYWVRVSDATTLVDGPTLSVQVAHAPTIDQQPADADVFAGATALVTTAVSGTPAPALQWYAGALGDTTQPVSGGTYPTVSLSNVTQPTRVWAQASNSAGTTATDAALATPWTARNRRVPARQFLFADGMYVAVGSSISTSTDGVTWTRRFTPAADRTGPDRIAYGNGVFVAVGRDYLLRSTDGITWTAESNASGFDNNWVCFGAGQFFTRDATGYVSSTDGLTWTPWTPPGDGVEDMVSANGKVVVLAGTEDIYTSADGAAWTRATVPWSTANTLWEGRLSVANGRFFADAWGRMYSSADGQAWTDAGVTPGLSSTVAYGNGGYVVGTDGSALYHSADGLTWAAVPLQPQQNAAAVIYAGTQFLTGGGSGFIFGSSDGQAWNVVVGWPGNSTSGLAYGNGHWVATGAGLFPAGFAYTSADLNTWVPVALDSQFTSRPLYAGGRFLAGSSNHGMIHVSTDGAGWTEVAATGGTAVYDVLVPGPDRILALAPNETATSTDSGATWTAAPSNLGYATAAAYGNGRYVAEASGLWYSPDGLVWQQANVTAYLGQGVHALAFGAGLFVGVGGNAEIVTSPDGTTWTQVATAGSDTLTDVVYADGRFIATGSTAYYTSRDGKNWARSQFLVPVPAGEIAYGGGTFLSAQFPDVLQSAPDTAAISVTQQPTAQAATSGTAVTFTVAVTSTPAPVYQWLKDGTALAGATDASLTLASVQAADAGTYQVRITNAAGGSALSQPADLIVDPAAPAITTPPADLAVNVGAAAALSVAASGNPAPSYQWSKDGTPISGATDATLSFGTTRTTDAGSYTVTATNQFGAASTTAVHLTVASLTIAASTPPVVGQSTTLSVDAVPGATFQWRYKGTPIAGATNATVTLTNLSRAQNGYYDVVLTYAAGTATAFAYPLDVSPANVSEYYSADTAYAPRFEQDGSGGILCAVTLPDGKFLVGGDFTSLDATARGYLARLNADGTLDTAYTPPVLTGPVRAMALMSDGRVIIGGDFVYADGQKVGRLARLNADLTLDRSYHTGGGFNDTVYAIAGESDGSVVVAGAFWVVGSSGRDRLARLDPDGNLDPNFATSGATFPYNKGPGRVLVPMSNGQWMFAGGKFSDGTNAQGGFVIRLNADGSRDETFSAGPFDADGPVLAVLVQSDGKVVVAGDGGFQTVAGEYVLRFTSTGAVDPTFSFDTSLVPNGGWVDVLADGGSGRFLIAGPGVPLMRIGADGKQDTTLPALPYANGALTELAAETGQVRIWGRFQSAAGDPWRTGYALLSSADAFTAPTGLAPRSAATIYDAEVVAGGKVLVRGGFTEVNGTASTGLARLNADGSLDSTFTAGVPIAVTDTGPIAIQGDGRILVHDGQQLQRLMPDGSVDNTFTPVTYAPAALAVGRDGLAVYSNAVGSSGTAGMWRLLADGSPDPSFAAISVTGHIGAITPLNDGGYNLWGAFGSINGFSTNKPAYVMPDGTVPSGPLGGTTAGAALPIATAVNGRTWFASSQVDAVLPLPDGGYLQAAPPSIYLTPLTFLQRHDASATLDPAFHADGLDTAGAPIAHFALQDDGSILVLGTDLSAFGSPRFGLMRLAPSTAPAISEQPVSVTADVGGTATFSVTATGTGPLSYQWYWDGVAIPGATAASLSLPNLDPTEAGAYTVQVSNVFTAVTSDAVTIHGPNLAPTITVQPQSQTVVAGSPATFSATATGTGPLAYQWRFSGYQIPGATDSSLTLGPMSRDRAGLLDVLVSDGMSVTTSQSVRLDVAPRAYPNKLVLDTSFAPLLEKPGAVLSAIVPGPAGKYYISGEFSRIGGIARPGLALIDDAFSVDPSFAPPAALALGNVMYGNVTTIEAVLANGDVLVREALAPQTGNVDHSTLVRLLPSGAVDSAFTAAAGVQEVARLAVQPDGKLIVVGRLTTATNTPSATVFRLNPNGSVDSSYAPTFTSGSEQAKPDAVVVESSGAAVFAGGFDTVNGSAITTSLVRLTAAGSSDPGFSVTGVTSASANTLALAPDGSLVVAGSFGDGSSTGAAVVRLGANGAYAQSLLSESNALAGVSTVKVQSDGKVFAATWNSALYIYRISTSGTLERTFSGYQSSPTSSLFAPDGADGVVAAFALASNAGAAAVHAAADGTTVSTGAFEVMTGVEAMAAANGGKLYIAGDFTRVDGQPAPNVARLNSDGSLDTSFSSGIGTNQPVKHLLHLPDDGVAISGTFTTYNGVSVGPVVELRADGALNSRFVVQPPTGTTSYDGQLALLNDAGVLVRGTAALHFDGSVDPTFQPNWNGTPLTGLTKGEALPGGDVLVVERLLGAQGIVARLGPDGTVREQTSDGLVRISDAAATPDGHIVVAGATQNLLFMPAVRRLDAGLAPDATFAATAYPSDGVNTYIGPALLVQEDGRVIVNDVTGLSRLKADGTADAAFAPPPLSVATGFPSAPRPMSAVLLQDDGSLVVGDSALSIAGFLTPGVYRFIDPAAVKLTSQPTDQTVTVGQGATFGVAPTGSGPFTYQWLKNGTAIAGATDATYSIASTTYADAGAYAVVVTNANGPVQSVAGELVVQAPVPPVITVQPRPQAGNMGGSATFSVTVSSFPAPTYQWRKDGTAIAGATGATYTIAAITAGDAGQYSVDVTNVAGTVTSDAVPLTVLPDGMTATHQITGATYGANPTVTITNTFTYTGAAGALTWSVLLPQGWSIAATSGDGAATAKPTVGTTGLATWTWAAAPASPFTFTYTLAVPAGATGQEQIAAMVSVGAGPDVQFLAHPDPLVLAWRYAADTNADGRISLLELTRVIELYNTRNGTSRTGCYTVQAGTEDGFAPDPARAGTAAVTLAQYHSADTNHDGKISLLELTRVIELYNYRAGTSRTGQYHPQTGTEDGFVPGP